jgi:hypothetical protein
MNQPATLQQLADVDAELEALEVQLELARQKKVALAREREKQQQQQQQLSSDDLQRQIEELKHQLAQQELEIQGDAGRGTNINEAPTSAQYSTPCQQPPIPQHVHCSLENFEPVKGLSEQAKQKHAWEKPAWALPSDAIPDSAIQNDSIQNPLLKAANASGYERKVHEADLALIPGKFVQPTNAKVLEPRMVWIVVNIDGSKVGKIVMHLYGNFVPLTDVFMELKGLELIRYNSTTLVVQDIDPNFYVHVGTTSSFAQNFPKQAKDDCYGIVLEGQDILQQVLNAPQDAVLTVKQSHIFPVKKTK